MRIRLYIYVRTLISGRVLTRRDTGKTPGKRPPCFRIRTLRAICVLPFVRRKIVNIFLTVYVR